MEMHKDGYAMAQEKIPEQVQVPPSSPERWIGVVGSELPEGRLKVVGCKVKAHIYAQELLAKTAMVTLTDSAYSILAERTFLKVRKEELSPLNSPLVNRACFQDFKE
jgi:hypothetical protein